MNTSDKNVDDILKKYGDKIKSKISTTNTSFAMSPKSYSQEYTKFRKEMIPSISRYERWCKSLGNIIKMNFSEKDTVQIKKSLEISHLDLEPWQPLTLSVMSFLGVFLLGLFISISFVLIQGDLDAFPLLFFFMTVIISFFLFFFMKAYPARIANKWRLKASSQMVSAILYVVVYMRHTPNLERAIAFASQHLQYPLALDLKKVFYDVQVGKFSSIKESLDSYLENWRDYSSEFIESFHLIEGSLYEPDDTRRIQTLEKALKVVLDGVYEKMLKFTHDVKSPLTNIYMLGIILPTLGLVLLPLASAMLGGMIRWTHVFLLFNILIPLLVLYRTDLVTFLRPGGHGNSSLLEKNPLYHKYKSKKPYVKSLFLALPLIILGILPLIFQYTPFPEMMGLQKDYTFLELGLGFIGEGSLFGIMETNAGVKGPFGVGALILGMFFPLGIVVFFSTAFKEKTKELIIERENTQQLELEFNNSLFQLGNRIGNGVPPEIVFGKTAESSKGLKTEDFFRKVDYNIRQGGMSVEKAIFDTKKGAIIYYPSDLISISMKILVESVKKGLNIATVSLMSISEYVRNIHKITARLRDLLAEVISDMKSYMSFLAPLLAGVVIGLASMITEILTKLKLEDFSGDAAGSAMGGLGGVLDIFEVSQMIPPYFLQIIVGVYLIQITYILTKTLVIVDSGDDQLKTMNSLGKTFISAISLYFFTALFATLTLFILVSIVLRGL
ncbi:hypothetical protein K0A97_02465 [Patescibacteria group bacterium]|nr:hypothetical protein [Patescibacteria group bacterium]